ncbi:PREDICTED: protoheme IX farnesyltransferase, mitochondrial [Dinoponera quadriceps]|uniref:Protoheme IX farnesyltransferase, mitochondrial n=1 Tax=Dinoponera quadriceps TaxID=609295 RepID=A0A6P3XF04_DINQU|nr:PREDICTED: protoheme IX farnesyltransferase, mitochondrial [Dinoponera quadriceps]XP_014476968.1 PREDICTED: protoheme IX farnesyltransferase, mitochondrial [Dinoponera quadriceps]
MLFSVYSWKICRHISCSSMSKYSVATCCGSQRLKSTKTAYMEEPVQSAEDSRLRVAVATPVIPFPVEKAVEKIVHKVKNNPGQVQMSEWSPIKVDYTKLHKHYLKLSKIKLTSLVVATTMAGYALAPLPFDLYTFTMCSLGTGLVSATANAINQFFEVPFDAQMSRTKNRVLVRGHLTSVQAVAFAAVSGVAGLSILYYQVNGVTAVLGAANLVLYTLIYTPMKRVSIANTWVGSVVGAIPPLMGWAGCTDDILMPGAWIMSGILYAWQFPHFNALSWNLRPDYSRAGYRMMAVTNPDLCRKTTLRYTVALTGLCYLAPILDVTNWWFALASTPLNASFLYLAWKFSKHSDSANSRKLFRFSLLHLPLLMMLMLMSKKHWSITKKQEDKVVLHNEPETKDLVTALTAIASATSSV